MRFNVANFIRFLLAICFFSTTLKGQDSLIRIQFSSPKMGSELSITCYLNQQQDRRAIENLCWSMVDSLNQVFSDYMADSEASQLARTSVDEPVSVSTPLFDLIEKSNYLSRLTNGHFDITIGSLTKLWRAHLQENDVPTKRDVTRARQKVGFDMISMTSPGRHIELTKRNMSLDFGGIAKGYIGDCLGAQLDSLGIHHYLIDVGGDLIAGAAPPGRAAWMVKIPWFDNAIGIAHEAVATSGPDYQFFVHKGKKYAHIIDPGTGWGISHPFSTTIIAPTGWMADGLASAVAIAPPAESEAMLQELEGIDYAFGIDHQLYQSRRFKELVVNISRKN